MAEGFNRNFFVSVKFAIKSKDHGKKLQILKVYMEIARVSKCCVNYCD